MILTLNISDNASDKAIALIDYLKSLDFLTIELDEDFNVPNWHKEIVRERIKKSSPEQILNWDIVKDDFIVD